MLRRLVDVGIDYITLGQPLNTLSGGELQRLKLAAQLDSKGNIYVLDEPTTGLHISDITKLVAIMNRLVNQGSTLIVIEHNLDVMTQADWIIDLGPEAGENGGRIMFEGEPKDIINNENSITGKYLKIYSLKERVKIMLREELEENYMPFQCMIISSVNKFNLEGVSTAQYYILDILDKQGSKTTKELAEIRGITQPGISKLNKRLLEKVHKARTTRN